MREFQEYTKTTRDARHQRWLWSWPFGLMVAVVVLGLGMRAGAVPVSVETLDYGADRDSEDRGEDASRTGTVGDVIEGPREDYSGPVNVLVLGVDRRPPDSDEPQVVGSRSDTIMLVRIYPRSGEVGLLSIPRDLLVEVEPGIEDRVNAAYSYGGVDQAEEVVEDVTGIPVDRYAIVDFEGFSETIDAMGGVEVEVEDEVEDEIPPKHGIEGG